MLKLILLAGIVFTGAFIGSLGVKRVNMREELLKEFLRDVRRMEDMLNRCGMPLRDVLTELARGSGLGGGYLLIAERLSDPAEEILKKSGFLEWGSFAELTEKERAAAEVFLNRLLESAASQEISLAAEHFTADLRQSLEKLEYSERKRAKILRSVWLLAGIGTAVMLI